MNTAFEIDIRRTVKGAAVLPYAAIARHILGPHYALSLTLCGDDLARRMYHSYRKSRLAHEPERGKTYASNVLSFPYTQHEGEIFLNVRKAEREARQMGTSVRKRTALLFVHGCLHLKGHLHGSTMESLERAALRKFDLL